MNEPTPDYPSTKGDSVSVVSSPLPPPPPPPLEAPKVVDPELGTSRPDRVSFQENSSSTLLFCMNLINTLTHFFIGSVVVISFFFANLVYAPNFVFNSLQAHVYLCVTGYMILMSQAVLTVNPYNVWSQALKHNHKKTLHWIMQIIGSSIAIAGGAIRIRDLDDHLYTTHGILGLTTLILTVISLVGGLVNIVLAKMKIFHMLLRIFHVFVGVLTLVVAYVCLCYGFKNSAFEPMFGTVNTNITVAFTILGMIGLVIHGSMNMFRKK